MAKVLVTYKINPLTGHPHRPPFETTEMNIEDHEKLFSQIIKDIKFVDSKPPLQKEKTAIPARGIEPDYKEVIKEKDALISTLQNAIAKMNDEIDELKNQLGTYKRPVGRPKKEIA